jgi:uroporphyrinogen decarboxylase
METQKMWLDSRTRFKYLITRKPDKLDRVMIDYWASQEIDARLCKYYRMKSKSDLLDYLDVDFRYIPGPKYIGPPLKIHSDGSEDDIWGVPRRQVYYGEGDFRGSYENVVKSPLQSVQTLAEVERYPHWPNLDSFDFSEIEAQCDAVHDKKRVVMFMGDRLNRIAQLKPMMYLRGVEQALSDMVRKSESEESMVFESILHHIREFYCGYLEKILQAAHGKIDVVVTGDDFGLQDGLICSPRTWRQKLLPGFQMYLQIAKKYGITTMHHTCGSVVPIIWDIIDAGLDILNPIQPLTAGMDPIKLKSEFGDRIIFHGGVSLQGPLRFGTPEQVHQEVEEKCRNLGANGGYIICTAHNLNADIKTPNIVALFDAYKKYCPYR